MQFRLALEQGLEDLKVLLLHEHDLAVSRSCFSGTCIGAVQPVTPRSPPSTRPRRHEVEPPLLQSPSPTAEFEIETQEAGLENFVHHRSSGDNAYPTDFYGTEVKASLVRHVSSESFEWDKPFEGRGSLASTGEELLDAWLRICLFMLTPRGRYKMIQASGHEIALNNFWAGLLSRSRVSTTDLVKLLKRPDFRARKSYAQRLPAQLTSLLDASRFRLRALNPNSWQCLIWYSLSLLFLICDLVLVPLTLGFDLSESDFEVHLGWAARSFWTMDVFWHFFVGVHIDDFLEMGFKHIAQRYLKTWFTMDVLLASVDWTSLAMSESGSDNGGSYERLARALRIARLLRVLRLARMFRFVIYRLGSSQKIALQMVKVIKLTLSLLVWTHFMACAWHGLSYIEDSRSWVDEVQGSVSHKYIMAAHWSLSQVHGTVHTTPTSTLEWCLATLTLLVGLGLLSQFVGSLTFLAILRADTSSVKLARACGRFMEKKHVPPYIVRRARGFLLQQDRQEGLSEQLALERELLKLFPDGLQVLILEATRGTILKRIPFFELLMELDRRTCRYLCKDSFEQTLQLKDHNLFTTGDVCTSLYFVELGSVAYHHSLNEELPPVRPSAFDLEFEQSTPILGRHTGVQAMSLANEWGKSRIQGLRRRFGSQVLMAGANICESALWSPWSNIGSLSATCDSVVLSLNVAEFERVATTLRLNIAILTARYAREFVMQLKAEAIPSDLFTVEYSREIAMNIEPTENFDPFEHEMFLSHYKAEAGTEATLLHEGFSRILAEHEAAEGKFEASNAVFLDSENLTNLSTLEMHVRGSRNLLILLTPGFLSRPWCLAEIVFAWRCDVRMVPIEIQRPGLKFDYPQEEFFEELLNGQYLDPKAKDLLDKEAISPEDLVAALHQAFSQIALPFSPHKSLSIREAEMTNIVDRCLGRVVHGNVLMKSSPSKMSNQPTATHSQASSHQKSFLTNSSSHTLVDSRSRKLT